MVLITYLLVKIWRYHYAGQLKHLQYIQHFLAWPERTSYPQRHMPMLSIVIPIPVRKGDLIKAYNTIILDLYLGDYVGRSQTEPREPPAEKRGKKIRDLLQLQHQREWRR